MKQYTDYQVAYLGYCVVRRLSNLDRPSLRAVAHNLKKSENAEEWAAGEVIENACIIMDAVEGDDESARRLVQGGTFATLARKEVVD